jgi:hypothetical protein
VIRQYAKGILSGFLAGLSALSVALPDVTMQDWVNIAVAVLIAGGVVTAVPNKQPAPKSPAGVQM